MERRGEYRRTCASSPNGGCQIAYDFIEGGTGRRVGLVTNEQAFRKRASLPRSLVDVSTRDQSTTRSDAPTHSVIGHRADRPRRPVPARRRSMLRRRRASQRAFIMSGSSTASIEDLGSFAPDHGLVPALFRRRTSRSPRHDQRARRMPGLRTLVFTVDVPEGSTGSATCATAGAGR